MIDWQRVVDLRTEIGAKDFDEVVPLFLDEVAEVTDKLREMPVLDQLEADLHALKGSALNLGFTDFAGLCSVGESLAAKGKAGLVDIAAILACFERSKAAFLTGLDRVRPPRPRIAPESRCW